MPLVRHFQKTTHSRNHKKHNSEKAQHDSGNCNYYYILHGARTYGLVLRTFHVVRLGRRKRRLGHFLTFFALGRDLLLDGGLSAAGIFARRHWFHHATDKENQTCTSLAD